MSCIFIRLPPVASAQHVPSMKPVSSVAPVAFAHPVNDHAPPVFTVNVESTYFLSAVLTAKVPSAGPNAVKVVPSGSNTKPLLRYTLPLK